MLTSNGASALPTFGTAAIAGGGTNATSFTQSNGIVTYNGTSLVNYAGPQIDSTGRQTNTSQPAFFYYLSSSVTNVTGNGANYTLGNTALTKVFDNGNNMNTNGTFTAPVTGTYAFQASALILNTSTSDNGIIAFTPNSGNILNVRSSAPASTSTFGIGGTVIMQLSASATLTFVVTVSGESGNTCGIQGTVNNTWVSGYLVC